MIVLGIDPGARGTGIALVDTAKRGVVVSTTVRRSDEPLVQVSPEHLDDLTATLDGLRDGARGTGQPVELLAVEGVVAPSPHANRANGRATTNVEAILAAAQVLGVVLAWAHGTGIPLVVIRPGKNGSGPLGGYPADLVTAAERRATGWQFRPAGKGRLKDQRSAYDVAMAAPALHHRRHAIAPVQSFRPPYTWSA